MKGFVSSRLHPVVNLLLLLVLMFAAACVAGFLFSVIGYLVYGVKLSEIGNVAQNPAAHPHGWEVVMLSQGLLLFGAFGCSALALVALMGYSWEEYFMPRRPVSWVWVAAAALLILGSIPAMSGIIEWNAKVHFPEFLHGFEQWARAKENQAQGLTTFLTRFNTTTRFLVGLLVIAVVPAISEELLFRGVIQRNLVQWFGSRHAGVWLAAFIFSAIHQQFFGFVPRFVLGLILGYLYEWSGNILVPMVAHFTQNAFQLLLLYLQQREWTASTFDPDSTDSLPWPWMLASLLFTAYLLYFLHQRWRAELVAPPTEMHVISSHGVAVAAADAEPTVRHTLGSKGVVVESAPPGPDAPTPQH
ncbi:CPBP family intramembrane glutamic endopeptidase [Hymenobacter persicinus]|uniref:CPBP family intramembrane metalloprotease n=1 Tax=Hymenobacter persicinus TaxID=2025506 RepID=A0A4V1ZA91_9BACT|nr:CPBP family intramembrane glutamic endopeptidase [Hymenobacter persicinus]RYU75814.1 CPBP family intramembrane metalloprotease [Hymenobacter persicinus]